MKTTAYLILNRKGPVFIRKNKPSLRRDEIAVGIRLDIPDSAFRSPIIMADLKVPDHAVIVPEITVEVLGS